MNAIVSGMEVDIDTYRAAMRELAGRCRCYYGRYGGIRSAGPLNGTRLLSARSGGSLRRGDTSAIGR